MTIKSISYHSSVIDRLKNPAYAAAYLNAILEEVNPESDLLKSVLLNIAEALGDRLESSALTAIKIGSLFYYPTQIHYRS